MYHSFHQNTIATNNINNTSNTSNLIAKHHQQKYVPSKQVQHQQQVNSQKEFALPKHSHHHHHHHSTYHQQLLLAHALENNTSAPNNNSSNSNKAKKSKKKKNKKKEIFLDSLPLHEVSSSTEGSKPQTPAKEEDNSVEKKENVVDVTLLVSKQDEDICVICHGPLPLPQSEEEATTTEKQEELAEASPCHHQFCYGCIKKWCFEYCSECPMCKTHIDKLIVGHGREEELENCREEFIEKKEYQLKREETTVDAQAEFACLDHRYFLGEIEILLNQVIHIHSGLKMTSVQFNSNYRLQSRAKNNHQRKYIKISELKDTLVGLQLEMSRMSQNIDPVVLMQQLYQIQESISEFSDHQVHDTIVQQQQHDAYMYYQQNPYALQTNSSSNERVLYSAKDFVDEYEDDYDQAYWEEDNFYRQAAREDAYFDSAGTGNSSASSGRRNRRK